MTRERLESLSLEALQELARREGLEYSRQTAKAVIIDLLIEAFEEDREERESSNNSPISVEEKKYQVARDEELSAQDVSEIVLPDQYNETRVVLLLRDPSWAFAYWEIRESEMKAYRQGHLFEGLYLRVHEYAGGVSPIGAPVSSFDIPIQFSDRRWYINLPTQGTRYSVELVVISAGKSVSVAKSNVIEVPAGSIAAADKNDTLIALSGLENLGLSSFSSSIPQRIIALPEDQFLR